MVIYSAVNTVAVVYEVVKSEISTRRKCERSECSL